MKQRRIGWDVSMTWEDGKGHYETTVRAAFNEELGVLDVVRLAAEMRGVDLTRCSALDAHQTGYSIEIEETTTP